MRTEIRRPDWCQKMYNELRSLIDEADRANFSRPYYGPAIKDLDDLICFGDTRFAYPVIIVESEEDRKQLIAAGVKGLE